MFDKVNQYTMTNKERIDALVKAVQTIITNNISGDFVECGVWKGGSSMAIALALLKLGVTDRKIYLYDTYEGMSQPTAVDIAHDGQVASTIFNKFQQTKSPWWAISLEEVTENLLSTGYPIENIIFVKGKVEETIPQTVPKQIALLRLDTDWYESTKHELEHLYPRLEKGGILIIDDYGHWEGARKAVDEYFDKPNLQVIDYTARMLIKE